MTTYIHESTQTSLDSLSVAQPHALLVTGPDGVGLNTIARIFTKAVEGVPLPVRPAEGSVTVETVRSLYDMTKTGSTQRRCIILDVADTISHQAQNALLKLLEEPVDQTTFILLSHIPENLLPTIRSRTQRLDVRPITQAMTEALLDALKVRDKTQRTQLTFIAAGLPSLLTKLARDSEAFEARVAIVRDARTYVQGRRYERLLVAQRYADSRDKAVLLIQDALKILELSVSKGSDPRIIRQLEHLMTVHERLAINGNVRLQLTSGVLYFV